MRKQWFVVFAAVLTLTLTGCFGAGLFNDTQDRQDIAALYDAVKDTIVLDEELDFEELTEAEIDTLLSFYADPFSIKVVNGTVFVEIEPEDYGFSDFIVRTIYHEQILGAFAAMWDDRPQDIADFLDGMDFALVFYYWLAFHGLPDEFFLEDLEDLYNHHGFAIDEGYPKSLDPVISINGSQAEVVKEYIIRGRRGDADPPWWFPVDESEPDFASENRMLFVLLLTKAGDQWRVNDMEMHFVDEHEVFREPLQWR